MNLGLFFKFLKINTISYVLLMIAYTLSSPEKIKFLNRKDWEGKVLKIFRFRVNENML
jgi:hypothetical protein